MKKSLIALAVLAASGAAMAQSSVTLYGVVDANLTWEDNGATSVTRMDTGRLNGSRWGLKGSEDLGGGMSAIFTLESGFNPDTGAQADAARFFNRQSFVGFVSGFGTVKLGRQMTPVYANAATFDSFNNALAGDSASLFQYSGSRTDNVISYSYAASGFRGEVQYGLGEVAGNNSASRMIGGVLGYKMGPVDVVLTYEDTKNATNTGSSKVTLLGGNYDFGVVKAFAAYSSEKGLGTIDVRDWHLGLTAPVGTAGKAMVSYIKEEDRFNANRDSTLVAVGYTHNLSKRTALYTSYGQMKNDSAVANRAGGASLVTPLGNTSKLFNVGVRHMF